MVLVPILESLASYPYLARKQVQVHDVIKCMHTLQPMMRTSTGRAEDMVPDEVLGGPLSAARQAAAMTQDKSCRKRSITPEASCVICYHQYIRGIA